MKILVITAGGSCAPLVTSIKQNRPDVIHFICSESSLKGIKGKGKVCGNDPKNPDKLNVLTQCEIDENEEGNRFFPHELESIDDLNSCYAECMKILNDIRQKYPDAEIIADYTGGTKSMTAGLAAASLDCCGIKLCVVKGDRTDLVKVRDGTQRIKLTQINLAFLNRQLEQARKLMDRYDYEGAVSILDETFAVSEIPEHIDDQIQRLYSFSKAFLAWDRFDHAEAWGILAPMRRVAPENIMFLEAVLGSRQRFDEDLKKNAPEAICKSPKGCGYELVEDLVLNAERRASQGRHDDAVGRLYRALEMLVQMRLQIEYSIDTGAVDPERIPEAFRAEYEPRKKANGKVEVGLRDSYELLNRLNPEDKLGILYVESRKKLEDSLSIRNKSLYAHGMSSVSETRYKEFHERFVKGVLDPFLETVGKRYAKRKQFSDTGKLLDKI